MTREDFFIRAFGKYPDEFRRILFMPERILMNRGGKSPAKKGDGIGNFESLSSAEKAELLELLCQNRTRRSIFNATIAVKNRKVERILEYYLVPLHKEQLLLDMVTEEEECQ